MSADQIELRISLRYNGNDVDGGTMPLHHVVSALQGFASAYGKLASESDDSHRHQLRVIALRSSSFDIVLNALVILGANAPTLTTINITAGWAKRIVGSIFAVIKAKRHTKGDPYNVRVDGNNNKIVIVNMNGAELALSETDFQAFKTNLIDSDLDKIAAPLSKGQIDSVALTATDGAGTIEAIIPSEERDYFFPESSDVTSAKVVPVEGTLVSLNKEKNRGTFRMPDGRSVPYVYKGDDDTRFHADFAYKGPVRVQALAHFDSLLTLTRIEIRSIERLQHDLPLS